MTLASQPIKRPPSHTKIVATVGPASSTEARLEELIRAGVDVFRLNTAHGSREEWQKRLATIRRASRATGRCVAVLVDLAGPKIRLGELPKGSITCKADEILTFVRGQEKGTAPFSGPFPPLTANYEPLIDELSPGDRVLLADGAVELRVEQTDAACAVCRVIQGGTFHSRQGINLPGVKLSVPTLTNKDRENARWAAAQGADYLGMSFVRRPEDVQELRELLKQEKGTVPFSGPRIIAKIEKPEAVENIESLVAAADAVMVARGDLGVEIDIAQVPLVQKQIIATCHQAGKPVIVATQMLESMLHTRLPTRAEATDVANAILDGADACMLSGETAVGDYPVEAVRTMHRIALATETLLRGPGPAYRQKETVPFFHTQPENPITHAVTGGAVEIAEQLGAKLLVVASASGKTALMVSQYRSFVHTLGVSDSEATLRRMCLFWGIIPMAGAPTEDPQQLLKHVIERGRSEGYLAASDYVVLVLGTGIAASRHNAVVVNEVS